MFELLFYYNKQVRLHKCKFVLDINTRIQNKCAQLLKKCQEIFNFFYNALLKLDLSYLVLSGMVQLTST